MSDFNPINNNALALNPQASVSSLPPRTTQDGLAALSRLDNSALQLSSALQTESLPPRPPSPPVMTLHLQNVFDNIEAAPAPRFDYDNTLPGGVHRLHHSTRASSQTDNHLWAATALPFNSAEEIDTAPSAEISFLQKIASQMPHIGEQIYRNTCELQKNTLLNYIRGDGTISQQAVAHAWQFFNVEFSESRYRAFKHIINTSHSFSAAEKETLLQSLQRARTNDGISTRNDDTHRPSAESIRFSDLPEGSVSEDTIEMLTKFGVTAAELQQFNDDATKTTIIREKLPELYWDNIERKLYEHMRDGKMTGQECLPLIKIVTECRLNTYKLMMYITEDIASTIPETETQKIKEQQIESQRKRILYQFYHKYMYSMPRLNLYKKITNHNLALLENRITPPKKLGLPRYRNNQPKLKNLLENTYKQRSLCLLNNMPFLPFIFDSDGIIPEDARSVTPYGDRGLLLNFFDNLINNPEISSQRLASIGLYSTLEMIKITHTGKLPLEWIQRLSDATLARMFSPRRNPNEATYHPAVRFTWQLRALQAVKEIGKQLIPEYDHADLAKLLAWIKPSLKHPITDDDLTYCLFTDAPEYILYLCDMSTKIINTKYPENNTHYPVEEIAKDLIAFCRTVTQSEAKHLPSLTAISTRQFNEDIPAGQACSLIAQQLTLRLIQEDREGNFQRWYDSKGNIHTQPPQEVYESFIIRPGELIPLNPDGTQQATIELEHSDNHSLLVGLINYYRRSPWHERKATQAERDKAVVRVEAEIVDLAKRINSSRQTTG